MIVTSYKNSKYKQIEKKEGDNFITLFTPSYNRAQYLPNIYKTLLNQTCQDFVWILVNDGSTDNTDEFARSILSENKIPMLYIAKENGGKHSAFKIALENTTTEFFQCMDDDDKYSIHSVSVQLNEWKKIRRENQQVGALRTLVKYKDGRYVSNIQIPKELEGTRLDISTLEYGFIKKIHQENWTCYKTEALRSVDLFPTNYWQHENHRFFAESIWQGRFARKYICRYYYVSLREYNIEGDSLLRGKKNRQKYYDLFINYFMLINEQFDYWKHDLWHLLRGLLIVSTVRYGLGISFDEMLSHVSNKTLRISYRLLRPISYIVKYNGINE